MKDAAAFAAFLAITAAFVIGGMVFAFNSGHMLGHFEGWKEGREALQRELGR